MERRTFLKWVTHGLGALFATILGLPALAFLIDARRRPARAGQFKTVARLDELVEGVPQQVVIHEVRRDAWTLHPNDVIGRVWLIRRDKENVDAFTTICPHLGCSVNFVEKDKLFICPCHGGTFELAGQRLEKAGLVKCLFHSVSDGFWLADSRPASFRLAGHGRALGRAHASSRDRRGALAAAGGELVAGIGSIGMRARVKSDRIFAALGPKRLLGHASRHEHRRQFAASWTRPAKNHRRRAGLRPSHADTLLCPARRHHATLGHRAHYRSPDSFPPPRRYV